MKKSLPIQENVSLKLLNTFGIEAKANYFVLIQNIKELEELLSNTTFHNIPKLILGDGSNILFTKNYEGLVIKNAIKGISLLNEDDNYVWIQVGAGENWHEFVMYCIQHGYGGAENLSLIPGTVGAAPIQNIGAYGVELKDIFFQLEAINLEDGSIRIFTNKECQFGYRDSIFKNSLKQQFVISSVVFRLHKSPKLNTEYSVLKDALQHMPLEKINIKAISDAIIDIRRNKLPNPKILGNAGSFFKNPTITHHHFMKIQKKYPTIPHFIQSDDSIKINAAWLIEQCGWKGKRLGNVGTYEKQALVLVNYGKGKGTEVLELATQIQKSVLHQFEILLESEVFLI
jgi:UDP-N-acetylmuramate dehydrogenase